MVKRKMPAHIVLPNGMWRFVKSGSKKRATRSRGGTMARRYKGFRRRRGGGFGGLLSGRGKVGSMIGMGIVGSLIGGYVGAMAADKFLPGNQIAKIGLSLIAGGPIGAAAAYVAPDIPNQLLGGFGGLGIKSTPTVSGYGN